ncbi:protein kinase [Streptomyces sp. NPDC015350]|uniref:protein kinase domain-containing protein n=1 Tax=Streptomyces sp. NPDC015350 TaxID=3364955 RepID=UPI0036FA34C7
MSQQSIGVHSPQDVRDKWNGAQIASGLAAAHTAGVVHRDLKPANVMLTRDGTVKILDFGMGSIVDDPDQTRLSSTGVSVGMARYMAPEQFRAEHVSALADLYALGCILYELSLAFNRDKIIACWGLPFA